MSMVAKMGDRWIIFVFAIGSSRSPAKLERDNH